jgi:rubrerythrin
MTDSATTDDEPGRPVRPPVNDGGDPACWLHRVCPACGRLADEDPPTRCPACGAELPTDQG